MIRIVREPIPETLSADLARYTAQISDSDEKQKKAAYLWQHTTVRTRVYGPLKNSLRQMATGLEYCMYCGESRGTAVDHFEPVTRNPLKTFDWLNHLLACSNCNSSQKGDRFPVAEDGSPLLIDPTVEDPFDHLLLAFSIGAYEPLTRKGKETIRVCDLNNDVLARGRMNALDVVQMLLQDWMEADLLNDIDRKDRLICLVQDQPLADVCQSMLRQAHSNNAELLFQPGISGILRRPDLQTALLR